MTLFGDSRDKRTQF